MAIVEAQGLGKTFGRGDAQVTALADASVAIDAGELVALMGPSGSGKTTLLRALSLIDPPGLGVLRIEGRTVCADGRVLVDARRLRRERMGVIFQSYNLIPFLSALDNVMLVATLAGAPATAARRRAMALLERLGLDHRAGTYPATLSGGEQQRLAVARAIIHDPAVILADEPTAALDTERGLAVMDLLRGLGHERRAAVLVVTHDERMLAGFDRVYQMTDGRVRPPRPVALATCPA